MLHKNLVKIPLILVVYLFSSVLLLAHADQLETIGLKSSVVRAVQEGKVYSNSEVQSFKEGEVEKQSLTFRIVGLHPKTCRFALRKLAHYESYQNHLDFIKKSLYNEKAKKVRFHMQSNLLPFDMVLDFIIPRIKAPGSYPFMFDKGFLKDLRGTINIYDYKGKCLFFTKADWKGPDTGINDTIFEIFSSTLSKISMENLIRISKTY
jgi:hypothetical protein